MFQLCPDPVSPFAFLDLLFVSEPGGSHPGLLFLSLTCSLAMLPVVWCSVCTTKESTLGWDPARCIWHLVTDTTSNGPRSEEGWGSGTQSVTLGEPPSCLAAWRSACLASWRACGSPCPVNSLGVDPPEISLFPRSRESSWLLLLPVPAGRPASTPLSGRSLDFLKPKPSPEVFIVGCLPPVS